MNIISLVTEDKFSIDAFSETGFLDNLNSIDSPINIEYKFEILYQDSTTNGESNFLLIPLNKANISDSGFKILSVSKRMGAFDRLLIPEKKIKKNIHSALNDLSVIAIEDRTILQLRKILPKKQDIEKISIEFLSPDINNFNGKAIILPWYINERPWLNAGYTQIELHPAEFTPEAGSGCWAILGNDNMDKRKKEVIRSLHHPGSLVFTNTERKFVRDFDIPTFEVVGVHLESPVEDKYHLYICLLDKKSGAISWFDFPSSTFGEMATEAIEAFKIHLHQQTLI